MAWAPLGDSAIRRAKRVSLFLSSGRKSKHALSWHWVSGRVARHSELPQRYAIRSFTIILSLLIPS
jgi:hypothetical protein